MDEVGRSSGNGLLIQVLIIPVFLSSIAKTQIKTKEGGLPFFQKNNPIPRASDRLQTGLNENGQAERVQHSSTQNQSLESTLQFSRINLGDHKPRRERERHYLCSMGHIEYIQEKNYIISRQYMNQSISEKLC